MFAIDCLNHQSASIAGLLSKQLPNAPLFCHDISATAWQLPIDTFSRFVQHIHLQFRIHMETLANIPDRSYIDLTQFFESWVIWRTWQQPPVDRAIQTFLGAFNEWPRWDCKFKPLEPVCCVQWKDATKMQQWKRWKNNVASIWIVQIACCKNFAHLNMRISSPILRPNCNAHQPNVKRKLNSLKPHIGTTITSQSFQITNAVGTKFIHNFPQAKQHSSQWIS